MSQTISTVPFTSGTEAYSTEALLEEECLKGRKWWCFLLSSIFTFLAGLLIVLLWRAFAFLCCRKEPELSPNDPKQKEQKANRQGKQEFEGTFMTEAKDWAGELISGQTTTGRILVSSMYPTPNFNFNFFNYWHISKLTTNLHFLRCGKNENINWLVGFGRLDILFAFFLLVRN